MITFFNMYFPIICTQSFTSLYASLHLIYAHMCFPWLHSLHVYIWVFSNNNIIYMCFPMTPFFKSSHVSIFYDFILYLITHTFHLSILKMLTCECFPWLHPSYVYMYFPITPFFTSSHEFSHDYTFYMFTCECFPKIYKPAHNKTYNKTCMTSKDSDQPGQLHSLSLRWSHVPSTASWIFREG